MSSYIYNIILRQGCQWIDLSLPFPMVQDTALWTLREASYDRRKIGRQASWPADLRGTSPGAGAYRTHIGPYHPPSMKISSRACLPPSSCTWRWNNLLSFDRGQLIFTYIVGRVRLPNISKDELNPSKKVYIYIIGYYNYIIILIQNEVWLR